MTTVVYHKPSNTIAYDSRVTAGNVIESDDYEKMIECERGHKWFVSGCLHDNEWFVNSFSEHEEAEHDLDIYAMVVIDGQAYEAYVHDGFYKLCKLKFSTAIGSGRYWAIAALDQGKKAKDCVKYASTRDSSTGGRIREYKLRG